MALVARETPIGQVTGPPIVSAGLKGADAVMIAGGNVVSEYWLMSRPEIKTAEQLKGGSVAIATFGGQADFLSRIALQKLGLNPLKDVTIVQIGTIPERLSALATGKVQAAMLNSPDNFRAEKTGFYNLVSVRLPYQGVGVATTRAFIRDNPDVVRRYVRSQIEAVHRIKTDRETGIRYWRNTSLCRTRRSWKGPMMTPALTTNFPKNNIQPWRGSKKFSNRSRRRTQRQKPPSRRTLSICASSRSWTKAVSSMIYTRAGSVRSSVQKFLLILLTTLLLIKETLREFGTK